MQTLLLLFRHPKTTNLKQYTMQTSQLENPASTAKKTTHQVTVIPGDGIGPEVVGAARRIIEAAGVQIEWKHAEAGKKVFEAGIASGVAEETLESIRRTKTVLKGPLETPVGFGGKSANVTLRKLFEAFGNVRPVREIPGIQTPFSGRGIDMVVVRENVEDLYAGIEHMQTPDVAQCLKLISVKGCEKIIHFAFAVARSENKKSVHLATKANIMKKTEGMMKEVFQEVSKDYPDIEAKHLLIDNCAHQLVIKPEQFEVIVTTNMNGDIISDLTSGLVGGLGLAPSANIGHDVAMFEAVHGSAPDIAGKDIANPTALIQSANMMLRHLGEFKAANRIEAALHKTLEQGPAYPADIANGRACIGTKAFADLIIKYLPNIPDEAPGKTFNPINIPAKGSQVTIRRPRERDVVGMDVFIEFDGGAKVLGDLLDEASRGTGFSLKMISNRGTMVYPDRGASTDCVDHWRCRFTLDQPQKDAPRESVEALLRRVEENGLTWMHLEKLNRFNGEDAYTKAQGED